LCSAQQGTKESFEKTFTWKKRTDIFFLFNIAWTLPACAHAQNCPTRLTMYHLFSLDPIVDLFTNIKCLQANPFAVCFAAYCSRYATDVWGGKDKRRKLIRDCQDCIPWFLLRICCLSTITAKQHFVNWLPKIT
jgi:hypothetical protein